MLIDDVDNNEQNQFGTTPLMRAIETANETMEEALLAIDDDDPVDITRENKLGFSAVVRRHGRG